MLKLYSGDGQTQYGAQMKLKLAQVGGVGECHHARVVGARTEFREDDFALAGEEELHSPDAVARQCLGHCIGHALCLAECCIADGVWLPRLAVVAAALYVAYGWAEQRGAVLLSDCQQGELALEVDKLLDYHLLHVAAAALHSLVEGCAQLLSVVYVALSVAAR